MVEQLDLATLRRSVEREINEYVYAVPKEAVGNPWPTEKVQTGLADFRQALVEPRWADFVDANKQRKPCVVIADDGRGYLVVFEPAADLFCLVMRKGNELISFGVDGDAVGCFLAR